MIRIARFSLAALCALAVGCSGGGGHVDEGDGGDERAEAQARQLAAPHEKQARECEAEGKLREAVKHYVAAIQALPEGDTTAKDFELREKAIKLVLSLDPPPAIPDDVQHMFDRAEATAKAAKDEAGWLAAAQEYQRALRYAPWEAKGNYNLGLIYELRKKEESAVRFLKLYLRAAPVVSDSGEVGKKIADLEVKVRGRGIGALAGHWRCVELHFGGRKGVGSPDFRWRIDVHGNELQVIQIAERDINLEADEEHRGFRWLQGEERLAYRLRLKGRDLSGQAINSTWGHKEYKLWGSVSDDRLELVLNYNDGDEAYYVKFRKE